MLLHKMLMCAAESETKGGEAAETRLLFQDQRATLPPTAWQATTNFMLRLCALPAATLELNSKAELNKIITEDTSVFHQMMWKYRGIAGITGLWASPCKHPHNYNVNVLMFIEFNALHPGPPHQEAKIGSKRSTGCVSADLLTLFFPNSNICKKLE